jgi:hypothetical protein
MANPNYSASAATGTFVISSIGSAQIQATLVTRNFDTMTIRYTNGGTAPATNVTITLVTASNVLGGGSVTYTGSLPILVTTEATPALLPNGANYIDIVLPLTVVETVEGSYSLTEVGTYVDSVQRTFSVAQSVFRTGG